MSTPTNRWQPSEPGEFVYSRLAEDDPREAAFERIRTEGGLIAVDGKVIGRVAPARATDDGRWIADFTILNPTEESE